ncbi:hypothetical protein [Jannaschia sp. R86511]|uniref:hypothetical protein n=1 Tax=Jannaschia sp. R86511 TaxID=3093853 RepID=UPI0036D2E76D
MTAGGGSGTDAAAFCSSALSSPGAWRTVRLVRSWRGRDADDVRAWLRRPGALRVEALDGTLLAAGVQPARPVGGPNPAAGDRAEPPIYQDYHWVAMLDPYELALGADPVTGASVAPVVVDDVRRVVHHGRPALEAVVRTRPGYAPVCSCCPLLPGADSDDLLAEEGAGRAADRQPGHTHAEHHVVRLDLGTGICVRTEQVGGTQHGRGHDVVIEAVDEDMADVLFETPPRTRRWSRRRRRPASGG